MYTLASLLGFLQGKSESSAAEPKAAVELHEKETVAAAAPVSLECSTELEADIKTPLLKLKAQDAATEAAAETCLGNGTVGESQSLLE